MLFPSECFPTEKTEFKLKNIFENLKLKVLFVWVATLDKKTNNIKKSTIVKKCFNSFQKELWVSYLSIQLDHIRVIKYLLLLIE